MVQPACKLSYCYTKLG